MKMPVRPVCDLLMVAIDLSEFSFTQTTSVAPRVTAQTRSAAARLQVDARGLWEALRRLTGARDGKSRT